MIDLPRSADVVIIGGGFAGMSTAWALARRGITDVIVVEREADLGRFASGRSAGLGRQLAEDDAWTALTVRGAQLLRTELSHAWTKTGGILTFDNVDHAQAYAERAARFGVRANPIERDMVLGHWPQLDALNIVAGLHFPTDGVIDVHGLLASFARGIAIARSAPVTALHPMTGGAKVITARGDIVARIVVDATGAWAGHVVGDAPLTSYKRHVYVLDARATANSPFVWHVGANELYVRADGGDVMASPCDASVCAAGDQQPDADGELKLRRGFLGSVLEHSAIARATACQRTFAPSGEMKLGRDPDRPWLVWAVGLGGHGATASAAVGETVAAAVATAL